MRKIFAQKNENFLKIVKNCGKFSFFCANIFRNWILSYVWCRIVSTIYRLKNWVEKAKITIFHYFEKILIFLRKYLSQLDFELRMMLYSYYNLSVKKLGRKSVWWQFCGKKCFFTLKSQFFTILRKFSFFWVEKVFGDNFVAKDAFYAKITIFTILRKFSLFCANIFRN